MSLEIPDGAIYGILGRSGAGKSTLIRCLNLLERPSRGRILFDGRDITALEGAALRRHRQGTGMIFQHFNLLHARSVEENVAVPLEIAGVARRERAARVSELLELVGLGEHRRAFPPSCRGQKQRVGIARALAANPRHLLCDEATSALDPETTESVLALLADINRRLGITIVLITHELEVVRAICDHAALLERGQLVESGALGTLLANPTPRVRQALLPDPGSWGVSWRVTESQRRCVYAESPECRCLARTDVSGVARNALHGGSGGRVHPAAGVADRGAAGGDPSRGVLPLPRLNMVLGIGINIGRSLPFVVLLIALIP